jgi:hypothetical protein
MIGRYRTALDCWPDNAMLPDLIERDGKDAALFRSR